ncbi:hypothetical protein Tco_1137939 [Tanacetum coccineum]
MSGTIPPIPPPFGTSSGNPVPQLLDSRGGSHVINVPTFDKEDFTSWKVRFLVFLNGLEHYLLKTLEDGPFIPMSSFTTTVAIFPSDKTGVSLATCRWGCVSRATCRP